MKKVGATLFPSSKVVEAGPGTDKKLVAPSLSEGVFTQEVKADTSPVKLNEYGYGFWVRFMVLYPTPTWPGKIAPWYFLARLTASQTR